MGVSAQAHRICVGMFAGGRSPAPPWTGRGQHRPGWREIFQIMIYILLMMGGIHLVIQEPQAAANSILLQSVSGWDHVYDGCCGDIVLQIQMLLIIAGDVELNPGPLTSEELTQGLATLIVQAPEIVKTVLGVWSPDKGDMVAEWNSNKFTVPVLREAMAWLQNSSVDEVAKQLKKKLDLATAMAVEIERLLPDECGSCQAKYTVGRVDKPTLQCAGCHQGIHEECLQEVLGEATATLSTLHGTLTWLCQACAPNYRMMTVVVPGGIQRPVNRRLATRQVAAPPTQNSAPSSESVDEISDRLAAISVSNSESVTLTPSSQTNQQLPSQQVEQGQVQAGAVSDTHQGPVPLSEDCPLFLQGECPFGISGRKGGLCTAVHRKRCNKFLRWGTKSEKGCKEQACPNLHPSVCPASLDLLCVNQSCGYKLHIQRCKRKVSSEPARAARQSRDSAGTASRRQHSSGAGTGQGKEQGGGHKHPSPGRNRDRSGCAQCGSNPGDSGTATSRRHANKAGGSAGNKSQAKTANKSDCQSSCCCAAATNSSCCACDSSTSRDSERSVADKCCAAHHRTGGQPHVDPAGGIPPPAEGFQTPTVQPLLEAWMESARKDMMQKQQELMLHMLMMQARPPMLGRGAYGLLPSL